MGKSGREVALRLMVGWGLTLAPAAWALDVPGVAGDERDAYPYHLFTVSTAAAYEGLSLSGLNNGGHIATAASVNPGVSARWDGVWNDVWQTQLMAGAFKHSAKSTGRDLTGGDPYAWRTALSVGLRPRETAMLGAVFGYRQELAPRSLAPKMDLELVGLFRAGLFGRYEPYKSGDHLIFLRVDGGLTTGGSGSNFTYDAGTYYGLRAGYSRVIDIVHVRVEFWAEQNDFKSSLAQLRRFEGGAEAGVSWDIGI